MKVRANVELTYDGDDGDITEVKEVLQVINNILKEEASSLMIKINYNPTEGNEMNIDNQWTQMFFKCVSAYGNREYECLHCGHIILVSNAVELSEKAKEHLKGLCDKTTKGN